MGDDDMSIIHSTKHNLYRLCYKIFVLVFWGFTSCWNGSVDVYSLKERKGRTSFKLKHDLANFPQHKGGDLNFIRAQVRSKCHNKQEWSSYFKCNTFFVLQFWFPQRSLQLLPVVILNWRLFVYRSLCLTILCAHELCQPCWLSVICWLISGIFNALAIKYSACRAEEWSFQQANKYPGILPSFSLFVLVKLDQRLDKQA